MPGEGIVSHQHLAYRHRLDPRTSVGSMVSRARVRNSASPAQLTKALRGNVLNPGIFDGDYEVDLTRPDVLQTLREIFALAKAPTESLIKAVVVAAFPDWPVGATALCQQQLGGLVGYVRQKARTMKTGKIFCWAEGNGAAAGPQTAPGPAAEQQGSLSVLLSQ